MGEDIFREWAILELFGHRRLGGLVTEVERFGTKMLRIDIPGPEDRAVTQFYGGSAIYGLTPTTDEIARAFAVNNQQAPVSRWDLTPALAARVAGGDDDEF